MMSLLGRHGSRFGRRTVTTLLMRYILVTCCVAVLWTVGIAGQSFGQTTGPQATPSGDSHSLRVMSFNLWHGGDAGGQPLSQSVAVIRAAKADIIGLQETHGHEVDGVRPDNGQKIADALGWHYLQQGGRTGVISRFPIVSHTARKWGVTIQYAPDRTLDFFNAHLPASPYQPYQLLGIPYGDALFLQTSQEAVARAARARGTQVDRLLSELNESLGKGNPVILTGDLNEPSCLDWTLTAQQADRCPIAVPYPSTKRLLDAGMRDAFRIAHPDEVRDPGHTWTPTTAPTDPKDRHDRIDYVFMSKDAFTVDTCEVVGEHRTTAKVVGHPWPSDHRAVVAKLTLVP